MAYGTINIDKLVGSSGGTLSPDSGVFRNRIINGAMAIDQRNAGAAITGTASLLYSVDRFNTLVVTDGVMTFQQVSDAPTGFKYSLKATATTADSSLSATQRAILFQRIEGYNVADLMLGTASASQFTLSFWVKSTLTGTFGGSFQNVNSDRAYPFTYTISSASTWEQKTITITGDTTGTWNTTNGSGLQVVWGLGVGSTFSATAGSWQSGDFNSATGGVSVIGTLNATWQVTGVQLEKGSTATSFDYRPYTLEENLCLRYYERMNANGTTSQFSLGNNWVSNNVFSHWVYKVRKRATPTFTSSAATALTQLVSGTTYQATSLAFQDTNLDATCIVLNGIAVTGGQAGFVRFTASNSWLALDSEL